MEQPAARTALEAERATASERVRSLAAEVEGLAGDSEDANGDDEHDPEGSTLAFERARVTALLSDAEAGLEAVDRALAKLGSGEYAACEGCGGPISWDRLEALPATRFCIACATSGADPRR